MSARTALNRLGLRQERERLARFERFLPALHLRQQQIQLSLQGTDRERTERTLAALKQATAAACADFSNRARSVSVGRRLPASTMSRPASVSLPMRKPGSLPQIAVEVLPAMSESMTWIGHASPTASVSFTVVNAATAVPPMPAPNTPTAKLRYSCGA